MLPNEPQSKLKRYRFNYRRKKHNNQQAAICVWISGIIIIIFLILGGIKLVNNYQSSAQPVFHSHVSRHVSKSTQPISRVNQPRISRRANQNRLNKPTQTSSYDYTRQRQMPPQPAYHRQRFASVNNAKEWAKATQQRWLHEGYTNYRVSSDGQGNYYLQFTK